VRREGDAKGREGDAERRRRSRRRRMVESRDAPFFDSNGCVSLRWYSWSSDVTAVSWSGVWRELPGALQSGAYSRLASRSR